MKLLVFLLLPCLSLSELSPGFGKCEEFFLNNAPPQFTPALPDTKEICQCVWDNNDEQKFLYATLYNTDWKIPIYSAYVFKSIPVDRCDPWYIEPQLDGDAEPCMAPRGHKNITNQAVNSNYKGANESGYDRGHLYPVQHTHGRLSMLATSTLTNIAPQNASFNQHQWNKHEKAVAKILKECTEAYVVTGVVPNTNIKLNARVTVSKYYWRATCCLTKKGVYTGQGYFGPDGENKVKLLPSIADLQTQLAKDYKVGVAPLRLSGLRILTYWLIIAKSKEKVSLDTGRVLEHITSLGFKGERARPVFHSDSTQVAQSPMAGRDNPSVIRRAMAPPPSHGHTVPSQRGDLPPPPGQGGSLGLARERTNQNALGLPPRVIATTQKARAVSTRSLYGCKWQVFEGWYDGRGFTSYQCSVPDILCFLQDLMERGRSFSTIKVYLAAISACHVGFGAPPSGSTL
ncbi:uncharacterized protein LOC130076146 [Rhinichthys klamathensis goyatoka]|uniref:uncharacterized protein LOC130076146 n=1 Tax=Rhinichthys klamathensis goyatoka TaxID=3034132 RepID=UPI0024B56363|nr:uncharacterized protein LOC130076146 [Rhinichthys klamathensis goyatoka]